MTEWNEHMEEEFPKVERPEVSFGNKDALKHYAVSDEEIQSHFQQEISEVRLNESRKQNLKKKENNRSVYFWISGMAAAWIVALVLRSFIVIPDAPAPATYVYQRPEKKVEKPLEQRDTIYLVSSEWLIPWDDVNFLRYSSGTVFPNLRNLGYEFPNGNIPWQNLVYNTVVDSTSNDLNVEVNQDSILVAKIDSSIQISKASNKEYLTVREFIAQEIDQRVEKFRKVKRVFRAARRKGRDDNEDKMVIEWKGKRFGL